MDVSQEEKQLRWLDAAKLLEQSLLSGSESENIVAKIWQKIGFYYSRASRQAEDVDGFKKLILLSISAFEKAAKFYGENTADYNACMAFAEYTRSWLSFSSSDRSSSLKKCRVFAQKALEEFPNVVDNLNYGTTANTMLSCFFDSCNIAPTLEEKRNIVQESLEYAENAVSVLSETDNKSELVFALSMSSLLTWYAANISELEDERKQLAKRCLDFSEKAVLVSKDVDSPFDKANSLWGKTLSTLFFTQRIDSSLDAAKEMLQLATLSRDNYYTGVAFYLLSFVLDWKVPGEENPEKKRALYEQIIKYAEEGIKYLNLVCNDSLTADTYRFYSESHFSLAQEFGQNTIEKIALSKKAIRIGEKGLEFAIRSGSPDSQGSALHALSKAYHYYSILEPQAEGKTSILKNALGYRKEYVRTIQRAFPSNIWILGVGLFYAGKIEADLAKLEKDSESKVALLENAISDIEAGVSYCDTWISSRPIPSIVASVADFEDIYGGILNERYILTAQEETLEKANKVFGNAAAKFKKVDLPSRVAESYWKIAGNLDQVGDHEAAAENFENAFAGYKAAAQKVQLFGDFYLDYSLYMKAWNEIESAKLAHRKEKYALAMQHYERTSDLLKQSTLWSYLSSNFKAWSFLEQAEDFSRKEKSKESIEAFQKAIKLFQESKNILKIEIFKTSRKDERNLVERLIKASGIREQFGCGRIAIEEAKILDMQGDRRASSEKYGEAAETFQKITELSSEQIAKEIRPLVFLCQAWQKMTLADSKRSPILYEEAAALFMKAKEISLGESARFLALAHSTFCEALEAGTEFEITRNQDMYSESKKYLQQASDYYLKAGVETASEYARGTERLFDAYVYMDNAKNEMDSEKESMLYLMAEKVLRDSADSFNKAKYPKKTEQIQQLLQKVQEERELALSLSDVLHVSTITSSTANFAMLSPDDEQAVGLSRFEHGEIQTKIVQHGNDFKVGEVITFEIQILNIGKEPISLNRIENLLPVGFQLVGKPEYSSFEGLNLSLKGKRLASLQMDELKIALRAVKKGNAEFKPRIVCVDETGRQFFYDTESVLFSISETTLPDRVSTGYSDLDNLMLGGVPENYAVVLTSPSSDERELLIRRFIEAGAKAGQTTFFVTVEAGFAKFLAEDFQSNFYLFLCNPRAEVMVKNLPNVFKLKGVESLTDIDIALTKSFRMLDPSKEGPKIACIEIVSDVLLQHRAVVTRKWLSGLIPELRSKGFTTLAVVNPQMHPPEEVQAILGLFEGEIRISEKETASGLKKVLRVRKLYNQRYMETELVLSREKLEL